MAVEYKNIAGEQGFNKSSLSSTISLSSGSQRIYVAIISTYEVSSTPKDVLSVTRSTQNFVEATDLRQDRTVSGARFNRRKTFVFYLVAPTITGSQALTATLSGTAAWASMYVFELHNAFQGAPANMKYSNGQDVLGSVGFSSTLIDTRVDSLIINSLNLHKSANGGNGFGFFEQTNLTTVASTSNFSTFWTQTLAQRGVAGDFETFQSIDQWKEAGTENDISGDYVFIALEIKDKDWVPSVEGVNPTNFCDYVSKGEIRKMVDSVSGLDHLEGETIKIQMDGDVPRNSTGREVANSFLVSSGTINLPKKAAVVHAGLPYEGKLVFLPIGSGSSRGTGHSKMRRVFSLILRLFRTLGLEVGIDEDHMDPIFSSSKKDLFTGNQKKLPNTAWREDTEIVIKQTKPLPAFITAAIIRSEVEEKL